MKHGFKPKTKASKQELVLWVKTCWRVWRKYLLWKRLQFKNDPRKLEMDDQLRIAQSGAPSFAMSLSLREEMRKKLAAAKTEQERDDISHNYRAAGDPFYNYFPPRREPPEGSNKVVVPFKAGKQVMLGDLVREGKVEHRAKFARLRAEDLAASRKAEHAIAARISASIPEPAASACTDFTRVDAISSNEVPLHPGPIAQSKYDAVPLTGSGNLEIPPAQPRPFKRPIALAKKKRSPLRKSPSPGKTVPPNVDSPTIDPETFMVVAKTPDLVAPHVDAEPQTTPKYIDLEPDDPSSQNEGGFMAEEPPPPQCHILTLLEMTRHLRPIS
jgi:hypothetical protein